MALLLGITAGFAAAAFFAAAEGAFAALPSAAARSAIDPPATRVGWLLRRADRLQHALALGHLLALVWLAALTWRGLVDAGASGPWSLAAAVLGVGFVALVVGELVPKAFAAERPAVWAGRTAPVLVAWSHLLAPLHFVIERLGRFAARLLGPAVAAEPLTSGDVRSIVAETSERAELEQNERRMLVSIFDFGETTVREVMTPRTDILALPSGLPFDEIVRRIRDAEHSRVPVYEGSLDRIVGLVIAKDLLPAVHQLSEPPSDLGGLLDEVLFVPEAKRIDDLLREFQHRQSHLAVVVDEYGGTAGIVTLEDILEELVGEIHDEYDVVESPIEPLADGALRVDGRLDFDDFNELTGSRIEAPEVETVGGLVARELGRVAAGGEEVTIGEWTFRVEAVAGKRILELRAWRRSPPTEAK